MAPHMREHRLQIMLSPEEMAIIDDFRFKHRMPTRAAAVRELLQMGLATSTSVMNTVGTKSSNIGIFGRGENSHDGKDA